jgi:hypothetical protein
MYTRRVPVPLTAKAGRAECFLALREPKAGHRMHEKERMRQTVLYGIFA